MKYTITPPKEKIQAKINLPSSKSISNRLLVIQALSANRFNISGLSDSDDTQVLKTGIRSSSDIIDIGHAGTSMRFLTAYFAATGRIKTLTGSERMRNRPIGDLVDALNQLGAGIKYLEKPGYPPIQTSGNLLSGDSIEISGSISSQFISAILLVAPTLPGGLNILIVGDLVSSSYVKMTLDLMHRAGIDGEKTDAGIYIAPQNYRSNAITVERDWSAASYWYEIASLSNDFDILLRDLSDKSLQGDSVVSQVFGSLGVHTKYTTGGTVLTKIETGCKRLDIDFIDAPDLVQTVTVASCLKNIPFRFRGVKTLKVKETNRIAALQNELLKLGYCLEEPESGVIEWNQKRVEPQKNISISTYRDHRMAMAFAPAAAVFPGLQIEDPEVVSKSYPNFWKDLESVGFVIEKNND